MHKVEIMHNPYDKKAENIIECVLCNHFLCQYICMLTGFVSCAKIIQHAWEFSCKEDSYDELKSNHTTDTISPVAFNLLNNYYSDMKPLKLI